MTLVVNTYELGPIGTNGYIVRAEADAADAVVVDPGGDDLIAELGRLNARCAAILITHGHWDHLVGVADLADASGAPVYMAEGERALLEDINSFTPFGFELRPHTPDVLLHGDETIDAAGITFETLSIPGHSPAHLAFFADACLFSGDLVFAGSVGRTDLPGANWHVLVDSVRMLIDRFPPDTVVYPGHGPATTLGAEVGGNPFLAELRA